MNLITTDIKTKNYAFEEFFTKTLKLYFKNFLELTLPYLIVMIPMMFFTYHYMMHMTDVQMQMMTTMNSDLASMFKYMGPFISEWSLLMIISLLLMSFYTPYIIHRVRTIVEADGISIGQSIKDTLSVYPGFLVTSILIGIMTIFSFCICCVPVLFIFIGLILAAPAATLDRRYFHFAVGDSFSLLSGRYWKTFGFFILLYIVCFTAILFAIMPFYFIFIFGVVMHSVHATKDFINPALSQMNMMKSIYQSPFYWIFVLGVMILGSMMRGILITAKTLVYMNYKNVPVATKTIEQKSTEPPIQA